MSPLHITNGDCAADTLRSFLSDRVLITCDVLHEGPAPQVDGDAWYETRARFLADGFNTQYDAVRLGMVQFDSMVAAAAASGEVVLWFEHDLFDQLLLIRTLDLLFEHVTSAVRPAHISLICIGEFPGIERFIGLGQLNAEQLESLYPQRHAVEAAHVELAREAWRAFRSSAPRELFDLMVHTATLPFLRDAIHRLFEEYPSTTNGLSRSADAVLRALDAAPLDGLTLFPRTQSTEQRPFMGDACLFDIVRQLAAARVPLVAIEPAGLVDLRKGTVRITDAGRDVLAGRRDAVALNGIDQWRGGVHLLGHDRSPWRWDAHGETLVS